MSLYFNNKKYVEYHYDLESEFERKVFDNYKALFGSNTVLLDVKKLLHAGDLGKTIPDGFLFDFSNPNEPRFYLVEVELASHNFYRHIFPQLTKFFSFIRSNTADQSKLVESLYRIVESSPEYKESFKKFLKGKELFKFLKDIIEDSSDILLVIDGKKSEIDEIKITYSETWGKYVKQIICKAFRCENETILFTEPDFEVVEAGAEEIEEEIDDEDNEEPLPLKTASYTEDYHLTDSNDVVKNIYSTIKMNFPNIIYNPQRYYIALKSPKGFGVLVTRKKLIRLVVFVPIEEVKKYVKNYSYKTPSPGEQRFWNAECTHVTIDNISHIDEIINLLKHAENFEVVKVRRSLKVA